MAVHIPCGAHGLPTHASGHVPQSTSCPQESRCRPHLPAQGEAQPGDAVRFLRFFLRFPFLPLAAVLADPRRGKTPVIDRLARSPANSRREWTLPMAREKVSKLYAAISSCLRVLFPWSRAPRWSVRHRSGWDIRHLTDLTWDPERWRELGVFLESLEADMELPLWVDPTGLVPFCWP
jgi:hypothetical protein